MALPDAAAAMFLTMVCSWLTNCGPFNW
jgi:hypothetical protein